MRLPPHFNSPDPHTTPDYLAAIVESSQDAIVSKNLQGIVTSWNPAAEQIFGYTAEEMIGRPISILAAPDVRAEMPLILERVARGEKVDHYETIRRRKDGRIIHVSLTISPVRDSTGKIIGASKIARDITDRKQAEAERAELLERERRGREAAERATELYRRAERNLALLVDTSDRVLASIKSDEVRPRILELAKRFFVADAYAIWRVVPGTSTWRIVANEGLSEGFVTRETWGPPDTVTQPIVVSDIGEQAPAGRRDLLASEGIRALLALPMRVGGRTTGALTFYFRAPREFSETECRMASALANLAASAMAGAEAHEEQRRLREEAQAQAERSHLLARISGLLGSTLDLPSTLDRIAAMAVPAFADWCSVHTVAPDGQINHMAVFHRDEAKAVLGRRLLARHPPSITDQHGIGRVLRTGQAELYNELPWEASGAAERSDSHLRLLRRMHLRSVIVVPMIARSKTLGAITFSTADSNRRYTVADLSLAEQLASGAALAIDNARLFADAERRRVEAQTSAEALRVTNEELERYAYVSSHDLKEPLRTITSYAQLLAKRYRGRLDPDADEFINYMAEAAVWMNTLIEALLSYSRLSRTEVGHGEIIDSEAALAQAISNLRKAISDNKARVTHDPLPTVLGNRVQLVRVFQNLLGNAIKYRSTSEPRIHVTAITEGPHVRITVNDNGIGIAEPFWTRVFDVFMRLHSRPISGAGIGLATCKKIVEQHGGRIWLESIPGKGTSVHFTLVPAEVAAQPAAQHS